MADEVQRTGGDASGGGSGTITIGTTGTTATEGSIFFAGASGVFQQDNANLFWDDTNNIFYVGANSGAFTGTKGHFQSTANSYSQVNSTNKSNGTSASSDWVATADTGTDSTNYIDMGINSSAYSDAAYTIGGALSAYLYSNGGTLTIGTQSATSLIFFTGGTLAANKRVEVTSTGLVNIGTAAVNLTANGIVRIGVSGGSIIDIGPGGTGGSSIWMGTSVTPTGTNYAITSSGASTAIQGSSNVSINAGSSTKANFSTTTTFTTLARSGGILTDYIFRTAAATSQTTGTEIFAFDFDMATNNVQHAGSTNYALQRDILIRARTHTGVTATAAITDGYTIYIDGGPIEGTNIDFTRSWALGIVGNVSFHTKLYVGASGISPTAFLSISAGVTANSQINLAPGVAPTSPNDGDIWYENTNDRLMFRKNATTEEIVSGVITAGSFLTPDTAQALVISINGVSYNIQLVT